MDGWITIGTNLSTDKFDRQIADLEKKMQKEEDKKITIETQIQQIKETTNEFNDLIKEADEYKKKVEEIKQINMKRFIAGQDLLPLTDEQQGIIELSKQMEDYISKNARGMIKLADKGNELIRKHQEINNNVAEYKQKIESVKIEKQTAEVQKMKDGFNNVGSSIENAVKKASKLALGIFGIRSAYNALRRASSELASYDQQYATKLEYIRYALTQAIAPVLRTIVDWAAKLLGYINMILNALFGVNLFSRGSAESFNKMKAGASGASKAVKEIKKQLAGFDEINMLTSQSDTGTSAGAGGVGTPDFDLSALEGEPPKWLQWIIDNKNDILAILGGIAGGLLAWKLGLDGIQSLGIGIMLAGIIGLILDLRDYLKDPSWENFGEVIQDIGEIILGVGILIGNVPAIVAGAIAIILGLIIEHWADIKQYFQDGIDWLKDKSDWVHDMFGDTIGNIYDYLVRTLQRTLDWFDLTFTSIKKIFDGIIKFITGVFSGDWEKAWQGIGDIFGGIWDWISGTAQIILEGLIDSAKTIASTVGDIVGTVFKATVNAILGAVESILNIPIRAINGLISIINAVPGINLGHLPTFDLPRLAVGGIVNMPNKGTMVGGAITGESGPEGVIPFTDQQAMSQLGREIGKNVVVNLTNITSMNGRVIGRELKQVQSEQDFAFNS